MVEYVSNFYLMKAKLYFIYCSWRKEFNSYWSRNKNVQYLFMLKTITIIIKVTTMKIKIRISNLTAKYDS